NSCCFNVSGFMNIEWEYIIIARIRSNNAVLNVDHQHSVSFFGGRVNIFYNYSWLMKDERITNNFFHEGNVGGIHRFTEVWLQITTKGGQHDTLTRDS